MKLFLALTLLSGSCIYGMEQDNELRKSQNTSQQPSSEKIYFYYDFPGAAAGNYKTILEQERRENLKSSGDKFPSSQFSSPNTINTTGLNTIIMGSIKTGYIVPK